MSSFGDPHAQEQLEFALAPSALKLDTFEVDVKQAIDLSARSPTRAVARERILKLAVRKVTWQMVGHVAEPGRYMFRFGWLTVTSDDLAVWTRFPDATFTLVKTASQEVGGVSEEFHLGVFEASPQSQEMESAAQSSP